MRKPCRIIVGSLIAVAALALLGLGGTLYYFKAYLPGTAARRSFPAIEGRLELPGLESTVRVYRDKMGVPHIYAATMHDLYFAQGFTHAQERFWQMDFWRHIGSGTLSEMFGPSQVPTDTFIRSLGWRRVAEAEWRALSPEGKTIAQAYADGVNAYLAGRSGGYASVSLEYSILALQNPAYRIEAWSPVHSLTWGKAMAWNLGGNLDDEIERAILLKSLGPTRLAELYPPYPSDYPVIVPRLASEGAARKADAAGMVSHNAPNPAPEDAPSLETLESVSQGLALLAGVLSPGAPALGSNSWAASGRLTASGRPLLANDMHLGIQMPSIWFENSLHCAAAPGRPPLDVTGFSFPGVPGVMAGHNARIAWGFTNLGPDVEDLFIEKVNPGNPLQYEVEGKWADFELRRETIKVAGAKPIEIEVRVSRHGPVISDSYPPLKSSADALALSWTALRPGSPFESVWKIDRARDWREFRAAAREWTVPAQNLLYADVDGHIGYQTPGLIPIRKKGDGTLPVPGWSGDYDWSGYIPFEALPWVLDPASGYIVTANNQANPRDYPYLITKDWEYGQRAARIDQMIASSPGRLDAAYFRRIQGDAKSLNAEALLPLLAKVKMDERLSRLRDDFFEGWDFQEGPESRAALLFETFWQRLLVDTFQDDLPAGHLPGGSSRWITVMRNLSRVPNSPWWDDKRTTPVETRDDIFARAFAEAAASLGAKYGPDLARLPPWGAQHRATFRNESLGRSGIALIEGLFNRGPFATGGGNCAVDATAYSVGESFELSWLPSEREIVDLANFDASLAIHTTGQSGHAYHRHYDDMAPLWAALEYRPQLWSEAAIAKEAEGALELLP